MLGKLLKYELKSTGRTFLPLYALLILIAFANLFFEKIQSHTHSSILDWPSGIAAFAYGLLIALVFTATFVLLIQRFNKNLLGDEGYLMFTLPVPTWKLITSKMLASALWSVCNVFLLIFSACIVAAVDFSSFSMFWRDFAHFLKQFSFNDYFLAVELLIILVIALFIPILTIYASMAIGHLVAKHKTLVAIGAFFSISIVLQMSTTFISKAANTLSNIATLSGSGFWSQQISLMTLLGYSLLIFVVLFGATQYILSTRLNLE